VRCSQPILCSGLFLVTTSLLNRCCLPRRTNKISCICHLASKSIGPSATTIIVHVAAAGSLRQSGGQPAIERASEPAADDEQAAPCELCTAARKKQLLQRYTSHTPRHKTVHSHTDRGPVIRGAATSRPSPPQRLADWAKLVTAQLLSRPGHSSCAAAVALLLARSHIRREPSLLGVRLRQRLPARVHCFGPPPPLTRWPYGPRLDLVDVDAESPPPAGPARRPLCQLAACSSKQHRCQQ
jgi:hypothetical protein